jgi:TrmH RNA methyltransferase
MRNKLTNELAVCGFNTVKALAEVHPERINRLFLREERLPLFTKLCKNLAERKRPYKICNDEELEKICKTSHHQGIAAMIYEPAVEAASPEDLEEWAARKKTGLLLCNVGNDHNLGAIIRAAAFFEASPIILTEKQQLPAETEQIEVPTDASEKPKKEAFLTTSAYRVAEGGMEYVDFRSVRNPAAFLHSAAKSFITIGTDTRARIRISDLPALVGERQKGKTGIILVVGNEETGIPPDVKEQCSILARIPGTGAIESLNVAQAAALFLQKLYER